MVKFILQEAEEKSNEISVSAEEVFFLLECLVSIDDFVYLPSLIPKNSLCVINNGLIDNSVVYRILCLSILIWLTQNYIINHWFVDDIKYIVSWNSVIIQLMIWFTYQSWSRRRQCCIVDHISCIILGRNIGVIYMIFKLNVKFWLILHTVQKWNYKLFLDDIWMNIWHVLHCPFFFTWLLGIQHWEIATSWSWKEED